MVIKILFTGVKKPNEMLHWIYPAKVRLCAEMKWFLFNFFIQETIDLSNYTRIQMQYKYIYLQIIIL